MSLGLFFDCLGVRLNAEKAADAHITLNFDFGDTDGKYLVQLENGVLNNRADLQAEKADATITLSRDVPNNIVLGQTTLDKAVSAGDVKIDGDSN
ncbi:alkyl sulfatase C-terminal domain-containing protein, partial [Rhizobiaceae sp. 2RAB30]